jgi:hypothetical protein
LLQRERERERERERKREREREREKERERERLVLTILDNWVSYSDLEDLYQVWCIMYDDVTPCMMM